MLIMSLSLVTAGLQMLLLLATAKLIGPIQYSRFSLIIAFGLLLSTISVEWLRMILARQAGMSRRRVRSALLAEIRSKVFYLGTFVLAAAVAGSLLLSTMRSTMAWSCLAVGVSAVGNMVSDLVATYLRFTGSAATYSRYSVARVITTGVATCLVAYFSGSGAASAITFGLVNLLIGLKAALTTWRDQRSPHGRAVLKVLARPGWSMASSSISMNAMVASMRATIGVCVPAAVSGNLFLALDLGLRGMLVIGNAISTWSTRLLYDSAHAGGAALAFRTSRTVSSVSVLIWFGITLYGLLVSAIVPNFVNGSILSYDYLLLTGLNLGALFVILGRVFLVDPLMAALSREEEIALSSLTLLLLSGVSFIVSIVLKERFVATYSSLLIAILTTSFYLWRNARYMRQGFRPSMGPLLVVKASVIVVAVSAPAFEEGIALVVVAVSSSLISDLFAVRSIIKDRRRDHD